MQQFEQRSTPRQRKQQRARLLDIFPKALNAAQAAQYLSVSERTIYNLMERGELPSIGIGRARRFLVTDLDAFLEAHRR